MTDYAAIYASPSSDLERLARKAAQELQYCERINVFTRVGPTVAIVFTALRKPRGILVVDHTVRVGGLKADEAAAVEAGFRFLTDNFHKVERAHLPVNP